MNTEITFTSCFYVVHHLPPGLGVALNHSRRVLGLSGLRQKHGKVGREDDNFGIHVCGDGGGASTSKHSEHTGDPRSIISISQQFVFVHCAFYGKSGAFLSEMTSLCILLSNSFSEDEITSKKSLH